MVYLQVDGQKDDNIQKYSEQLSAEIKQIAVDVKDIRNSLQHEMILKEDSDRPKVSCRRDTCLSLHCRQPTRLHGLPRSVAIMACCLLSCQCSKLQHSVLQTSICPTLALPTACCRPALTPPLSARIAPQVVAYLTELKTSIDKMQAQAAQINAFQKLFKVSEVRLDDLADTAEEATLKYNLWAGADEFHRVTEKWRTMPFDSINYALMEEAMNGYNKMVFKMERGLTPNKLVPKFRAHVDEYRNMLPIIQALRNKCVAAGCSALHGLGCV